MKRTFHAALLLLLLCSPPVAQTQAQVPGGPASQTYSQAEYDAYQVAAAERDPDRRVILVDEFASKYPNSPLLIYVYPLCYTGYGQLKNHPS